MLLDLEARSGNTPKALENAPQIRMVLVQELIHAYNVLASRRTSGTALNPIQLSEIRAFIDLYGPPSVPVDTFVDFIGVMDSKYLELSNGNRASGNS